MENVDHELGLQVENILFPMINVLPERDIKGEMKRIDIIRIEHKISVEVQNTINEFCTGNSVDKEAVIKILKSMIERMRELKPQYVQLEILDNILKTLISENEKDLERM